jgi:Mor family transcriptional regulator
MNILKYTRDHIQQLVNDGVCEVQALRDWDIAKAKNEGKKINDIAYENRLCSRQVYRVINKFQGKA